MQDYEVATFNRDCIKIMSEVSESGLRIAITRDGIPVAELVPAPGRKNSYFGLLRGTVKIRGDIVGPTWEDCKDALK